MILVGPLHCFEHNCAFWYSLPSGNPHPLQGPNLYTPQVLPIVPPLTLVKLGLLGHLSLPNGSIQSDLPLPLQSSPPLFLHSPCGLFLQLLSPLHGLPGQQPSATRFECSKPRLCHGSMPGIFSGLVGSERTSTTKARARSGRSRPKTRTRVNRRKSMTTTHASDKWCLRSCARCDHTLYCCYRGQISMSCLLLVTTALHGQSWQYRLEHVSGRAPVVRLVGAHHAELYSCYAVSSQPKLVTAARMPTTG